MQLTRGKGRIQSSDILPLFVLGSLGLQGLLLVCVLWSAISQSIVAHKPPPVMVQLADGRSELMEPIDHNQRTPEAVRQFVKQSMGLMFTWNARLPSANSTDPTTPDPDPVLDKGVAVGDGHITTASWQASFALQENFRTPFLEQVAELTPDEVFRGEAQSVLSFEQVSLPRQVKSGVWQIDVVANLVIFDAQNQQGVAIPFNKTIFLRAVEPTTDPLPPESTPIQQAVYRVRQSGLEITEMRDLDIQQLNGQ